MWKLASTQSRKHGEFDSRRPLQSKEREKVVYHCHITLKDVSIEEVTIAAKLIKGKVTSIDLWKDERHQCDRMITKYSKSKNFDHEYSTLSKRFDVQRLKVEESISKEDYLNTSIGLYNECHIKVNKELGEIPGYVKSKNIDEKGLLFYNKRGTDLNNFEMLEPYIVSAQFERVIFDSNFELDRWWSDK